MFTIPIVILLLFVAIAALALWIDSTYSDALGTWRTVLGITIAGGRAIATTVAGATITVAAIVFSITALSTQMVASQYSPRAMAGFFEDPFQQTIIGLVIGTFTYSLLILGALSNAISDPVETSPSLSVTLTILFGVASAFGIVAYINHSLRRMEIDSVVRRIAQATIHAIDNNHDDEEEDLHLSDAPQPVGESAAITSEGDGWIVALEPRSALQSLPPGSTARIDVRAGEAVAKGDRIATIWPQPGDDWDGRERLRGSVVVRADRSLELDPSFGIRQLVDIALRALSPGINDPTTAVDVIHHLKSPIRRILMSPAPRRVFSDEEDRRVFLAMTPSRSDYVRSAFSEIRLAAKGQPYVISALIEVLEDLRSDLAAVDLSGREGAVDRELGLVIEMAKGSGLPESDLEKILEGHLEVEEAE